MSVSRTFRLEESIILVDENVMTLQPGVEGWQGALSVRCTADASGVLNAGGRSSYSVVDLRVAYIVLGSDDSKRVSA